MLKVWDSPGLLFILHTHLCHGHLQTRLSAMSCCPVLMGRMQTNRMSEWYTSQPIKFTLTGDVLGRYFWTFFFLKNENKKRRQSEIEMKYFLHHF